MRTPSSAVCCIETRQVRLNENPKEQEFLSKMRGNYFSNILRRRALELTQQLSASSMVMLSEESANKSPICLKRIPNKEPKSEKEDKEIEEIASKIREDIKKKMVQIKITPVHRPTQPVEKKPAEDIFSSEDWTSVQGQFGWAELGETIIPYLTRSGEKYVSLRMADSKIFVKFKDVFTNEIRECFSIKTVKATKVEARLLNEINFRHCDNFFGSIEFTVNDELVALSDFIELYDFLKFCLSKLIDKNSDKQKRCGFIRICSQNYVPFVWHCNKQFVPLFYFEGECKYLEDRSVDLSGWNLTYLKLCCKIQGIRKTLFDSESIRVVDLELVKMFFPADALFEEIWLSEYSSVDNLVNMNVQVIGTDIEGRSQNTDLQLKNGKPPPPYPDLNIFNNNSISGNIQNSFQDQFVKNISEPKPINNNYLNTSPVTKLYRSTSNNVVNTHPVTTVSRSTSNNIVHTPPAQNVYQRSTAAFPISTLIPNTSTYKQTPNLRPVSVSNNNLRSKALQIPDFPFNEEYYAYYLVRTQVEDRFLHFCINFQPQAHIHTTLLVSLEEVATTFFGGLLPPMFAAVRTLNIDIYLPNKHQIRTLQRAGRYPTAGLIKVKDFADQLPNLKYILGCL